MRAVPITDPATMTNTQIVREYRRLVDRQTVCNDAMIESGHGHVKMQDIIRDPSCHPSAPEYAALMDRCRTLSAEADLRYGPGLIIIEHLVTDQGSKYRRTKQQRSVR